jgi:hypothetical protein
MISIQIGALRAGGHSDVSVDPACSVASTLLVSTNRSSSLPYVYRLADSANGINAPAVRRCLIFTLRRIRHAAKCSCVRCVIIKN